jgi:pimeloyl-ACP methyl ester carboxylesterase
MQQKTLLATLLVTVVAVFTLAGTTSAQAAAARNCQEVQLPVGLAVGLPKTQRLAGQLCLPPTWQEGQTIDVLVAGTSYDRNYWDFGYNNSQYSYVNKTLAEGRATFALDRLGTGKSSRPLSAILTATSSAYTIHEAVQWLRNEKKFEKVHLIGHSLGSAINVEEAATYHDVDKLILTGYSNMLNVSGSLPGVLGLRPALLDPVLKDKGYLDSGYLTTAPSVRPDVFYGIPMDPAVIAYDEAHKTAFSATELATGLASLEVPALLNISQRITAPTYIIVGNQDKIFCGGSVDCTSINNFTAYHRPYYSRAASFHATIIPSTGHALTTAPSAQQSFGIINDWLQEESL